MQCCNAAMLQVLTLLTTIVSTYGIACAGWSRTRLWQCLQATKDHV